MELYVPAIPVPSSEESSLGQFLASEFWALWSGTQLLSVHKRLAQESVLASIEAIYWLDAGEMSCP